MDKIECKSKWVFVILITAFIFALGPMVGGYFLGRSIERMKANDRNVAVKGLAERVVKSDLAVWQLTYKNSGDNLVELDKKMKQDQKVMLDFLTKQGFKESEIQSGYTEVVDKLAREYTDSNNQTNRYIVSSTLTVRSYNPDQVVSAASQLGNAIQNGVIVSGNLSFF